MDHIFSQNDKFEGSSFFGLEKILFFKCDLKKGRFCFMFLLISVTVFLIKRFNKCDFNSALNSIIPLIPL